MGMYATFTRRLTKSLIFRRKNGFEDLSRTLLAGTHCRLLYTAGVPNDICYSICVTMMSRLILHLYEVAPIPISTPNDAGVLSVGSLFATELTQGGNTSDDTWREEDATAVGHADDLVRARSPEDGVDIELNRLDTVDRCEGSSRTEPVLS